MPYKYNQEIQDEFLQGCNLWIIYYENYYNITEFLKLNFPRAHYLLGNKYDWDAYYNEETVIWYDFLGNKHISEINLDNMFTNWKTDPVLTSNGTVKYKDVKLFIIATPIHPVEWYDKDFILNSRLIRHTNGIYHFHVNNKGEEITDVYDNYKNFNVATHQ